MALKKKKRLLTTGLGDCLAAQAIEVWL